MNILFFYRIYPNYGGVEVVTTVLANRFFKDGNHVSIVSIEQPHMDLADQLPTDINIHKLEYPVNCAKNIKKLHDIIVDEKIDIVVNQWGLPSKTTKLCNSAIKGTHCKLVSVLHGSPYTSKVILQAQDKVQNSKNPILKIFYKCLLKCKEEVIKYNIRYNIAHNSKYILLSKGFIKPLINYANPSDTSNIVAIGNPITIPVNLNGFSLDNKKKADSLYR